MHPDTRSADSVSATASMKSTSYGERCVLPAFAPTFRLALRLRSKPPTPIEIVTSSTPTPGAPPVSG